MKFEKRMPPKKKECKQQQPDAEGEMRCQHQHHPYNNTPPEEWDALYAQWKERPHEEFDASFEELLDEITARCFSPDLPLPLARLDALVLRKLVCCRAVIPRKVKNFCVKSLSRSLGGCVLILVNSSLHPHRNDEFLLEVITLLNCLMVFPNVKCALRPNTTCSSPNEKILETLGPDDLVGTYVRLFLDKDITAVAMDKVCWGISVMSGNDTVCSELRERLKPEVLVDRWASLHDNYIRLCDPTEFLRLVERVSCWSSDTIDTLNIILADVRGVYWPRSAQGQVLTILGNVVDAFAGGNEARAIALMRNMPKIFDRIRDCLEEELCVSFDIGPLVTKLLSDYALLKEPQYADVAASVIHVAGTLLHKDSHPDIQEEVGRALVAFGPSTLDDGERSPFTHKDELLFGSPPVLSGLVKCCLEVEKNLHLFLFAKSLLDCLFVSTDDCRLCLVERLIDCCLGWGVNLFSADTYQDAVVVWMICNCWMAHFSSMEELHAATADTQDMMMRDQPLTQYIREHHPQFGHKLGDLLGSNLYVPSDSVVLMSRALSSR